MIDLVIFDCDGVLIDSEAIALGVLRETLAGLGLELDGEDVQTTFQGRSQTDLRAILLRRYGLDLDAQAMALMTARTLELFEHDLETIPGMAALVAELTVPACVASSSAMPRLHASLTLAGLARRFDGAIFSVDQVRLGKPEPDLFQLAARSMAVPPGRCMVVEDSPDGVRAALAAGMAVIGFTAGSHAGAPAYRDRLQSAGASAIAQDAATLRGLLRDRNCLG